MRTPWDKSGWASSSDCWWPPSFSPRGLPSFYVHILVLMVIFSIFAMSLDILMGYAGLPSLGHAAFFGVAAYTAGLLAVRGGFQWWGAGPDRPGPLYPLQALFSGLLR